jgi:hypothetical protein
VWTIVLVHVVSQAAGQVVETLVGDVNCNGGYDDGVGTNANFNYPNGLAFSRTGTFALIVSVRKY